jgi:sugar phosphate permease
VSSQIVFKFLSVALWLKSKMQDISIFAAMLNVKRNPFLIISVIIAGEAIFFLPFVLPRIFRPTILAEYGLSNLQLGTAFSIYGMVAIASYFFGGPLADRFSPRALIAWALCLTGVGGFFFLFDLSYSHFLLIYGYWGFTTIFLMWAAMIKATRLWGGNGFQGRAFGLLESGRGLTAAMIGLFALAALSSFSQDQNGGEALPIKQVIFSVSAFVFLLGLIVAKWMPNVPQSERSSLDKIEFKRVFDLMKNPKIWLQGFVIVFAYVGYKMTDDFSLYANQVLGFDELKAASVGTAALWLRPVFALLAGFAADRWRVHKVIGGCFLLMLLGGSLMLAGILDSLVVWALMTMVFTVVGIYGLRGIYFSSMDDLQIPKESTGTAVGIMSVLGYTPDVFISPIMGFLLDHFPGAEGHHYVFGIIGLAGILGLLSVLMLAKKLKAP